MVDLSDVDLIRSALILLCRDRERRINGKNLDVPNRWMPQAVRDPETRMFFSDAGAWDFIADAIGAGTKLRCIKPSEKFPDFAYYLLEPAGEGKEIYMKIGLNSKSHKIVGVSFHYSDDSQ